jgi:hypothetical protein
VVGAPQRLFVSTWGHPRPYLKAIPFVAFGAFWIGAILVTALVDVSHVEATALEWFSEQVDPALQAAFASVQTITEPLVLAGMGLVTTTATLFFDRSRGLLMGAGALGAATIAVVSSALADRAVGPVPSEWAIPGDTYPDPASAVLAALLLAFAWPWGTAWIKGVRQLALALATVTTLGTAMILGAVRYPIDVIAGVAIGASVVVLVGLTSDPRISDALRIEPEPDASISMTPSKVPAARADTI